MDSRRTPLRIEPAPDPLDPDLAPLLGGRLAAAWSTTDSVPVAAAATLRRRLLGRAAASSAAAAAMSTSRLRQLGDVVVATGVSIRTLYTAPSGRALRGGEPRRASLVELQPGARWTGPGPEHHREWLVLRGALRLAGTAMEPRDYRVSPTGLAAEDLVSDSGALLFLRQAELPAFARSQAYTVRDAESDWPDYAPGIRRRLLWQHEGQASMLYHAEPGASVPSHVHGHDEECLMVQGELFLDDLLLQPGDYQLAPAGTGHRITETDTGVVIYAHGDVELKFVG